jgi:hypothetical protein
MTTAAVTANSAQLHHRAERCSACFLKGVAMRFNFGAFLFADGAQKLAKKLWYMSKIAAIFARADNTHRMCTQPIANLPTVRL